MILRERENRVKETWLDRAVAYVSPQRALARTNARVRHELAMQFRGAEDSRLRAEWIFGDTGNGTRPP